MLILYRMHAWRYILDKYKRIIRKKEWNQSVDVAIKTRIVSDYNELKMDARTDNEIRNTHRIRRYLTLKGQRRKVWVRIKIMETIQIGKCCSRRCQKKHWMKHHIIISTEAMILFFSLALNGIIVSCSLKLFLP